MKIILGISEGIRALRDTLTTARAYETPRSIKYVISWFLYDIL